MSPAARRAHYNELKKTHPDLPPFDAELWSFDAQIIWMQSLSSEQGPSEWQRFSQGRGRPISDEEAERQWAEFEALSPEDQDATLRADLNTGAGPGATHTTGAEELGESLFGPGSAFETVFNPGAQAQRDAVAAQQAGAGAIAGVQLQKGVPEIPYIDPNTIKQYESGTRIAPPKINYGAPGTRQGEASDMMPAEGARTNTTAMGQPAGDFGPALTPGVFDDPRPASLGPGESAWAGQESAFSQLGPSAFATAGPSAYEGVQFDPEALAAMGQSSGYFGDVMQSGTDAQAEAEYARRQQQAEQLRRANTEAALAQLDMSGQGGMGSQMLAELSNQQAMVGDVYQAGLDTNAFAQQRRDSAAGSRADIAERMGRGQLDADALRAAGVDEYTIAQLTGEDRFAADTAAGVDAFTGDQAAGVDAFTNADWDRWLTAQETEGDWDMEGQTFNATRDQVVDDANIKQDNEFTLFNRPGGEAERQLYEDLRQRQLDELQKQGMVANAKSGLAATLQGGKGDAVATRDTAAGLLSDVSQWYGLGDDDEEEKK